MCTHNRPSVVGAAQCSQNMSVATSPLVPSAASLQDHLRKLDLTRSSPLMRTVAREIQAIEQALARGVTYRQIASAIVTSDGTANPKTLRECVYRVRKRMATAGAQRQIGTADDANGCGAAPTEPHPARASLSSLPTPPGSASDATPAGPSSNRLPAASATDPLPTGRSNPPPDFIRDILASPPDVDELARQYRARKAARRAAAAPASPSPHPINPNSLGTTP
jgi:hypothetical protein